MGILDQQVHGVEVIGDPGKMLLGVGAGAPPREAWPPDVIASSHETEDVVVRAASVRGLLHRNSDNLDPRQDMYGIGFDELTGTLVVVVCDGVGSLKYSHKAAAYVCRELPWRYLALNNWEDAILEVNVELAERERAASAKATDAPQTMATTVIGVATVKSEEGFDLHLVSVGDSQAWLLDSDSGWHRLELAYKSDDDGLMTGKTKALPANQPVIMEQHCTLESGRLFLMTDGVADPLALNTQVQDQLGQWWTEPPDPFTFGRQIGFARRTFVDDRTVVGIWFQQSPGARDIDAADRAFAQTVRTPSETQGQTNTSA